MKHKISTFFKRRKVNVFLLFIALALLFSVLTKLSKDYTQTVVFKIQPTNIPEDKLIVLDSAESLKIDLTTYGFKLLRYYFSKPTVDINIENLDKDETHYLWTEKKAFSEIVSQFDPNVKIENINPDTLRLRYDTNSVKKIPVVLDAEIEYALGFNIANSYVIEPDSVRIIGPNILIDTINTISTKQIQMKGVNSDISRSVALELIDHEQLRFSHIAVRIAGKVEKFTEGSVNVPVIIKNVPDNISLNIYPKSVPVVFYSSLTDFKSISANSFVVACDYKDLKANTSYLIPEIIQSPEQIKSAKLSVNKIEFIITQ